jgi:predicted lipid-binding transport protein (Tim44 family)
MAEDATGQQQGELIPRGWLGESGPFAAILLMGLLSSRLGEGRALAAGVLGILAAGNDANRGASWRRAQFPCWCSC